MATIKFAFFLLTLSTLLQPYHARHLHDASIYGRSLPFKTAEVLHMVTKEEFWSPDCKSSDLESLLSNIGQMTYSRKDPNSLPSPKDAPSQGQATYGRNNPNSPPSPDDAPSQGHATYGRDNPNSPPSPDDAPSQGQTTYGRDNPKSPPSPEDAPSQGHKTYGETSNKVLKELASKVSPTIWYD